MKLSVLTSMKLRYFLVGVDKFLGPERGLIREGV